MVPKRYILFSGHDYEAKGGWDDLSGWFDDLKEAQDFGTKENN
jgi:hypothetical protein